MNAPDVNRAILRMHIAAIEAKYPIKILGMLPRDKVESEIAYLTIALEKTAGPDEREAWDWLMDAVTQFYAK